MKVRTCILPFSLELRDRDLVCRGAAIEQIRADQALESEWRRRVRANPKEQARIQRLFTPTEGECIEHSSPRAA